MQGPRQDSGSGGPSREPRGVFVAGVAHSSSPPQGGRWVPLGAFDQVHTHLRDRAATSRNSYILDTTLVGEGNCDAFQG